MNLFVFGAGILTGAVIVAGIAAPTFLKCRRLLREMPVALHQLQALSHLADAAMASQAVPDA